ncbi:MAG: response regulator [Lachnospiraceae bacterium]|nr:response regulator [Lachnospiraceae bacterium]
MDKWILVVDDDAMNLRMAEFILTKNGYSVVKSESGQAALEVLKNKEIELILLDIEMPEMNGFEMMEMIQKDAMLKKIPVIFLTADRSAETEEKCFQMGAVDYIGKPFIPSIMIQRVKRTIELEEYRKSLEVMVEVQLERITQLQQEIIITMANLIESRDGTTGEHIKNTSRYVNKILDVLVEKGIYEEELTKEYISYIKKASPLHDVGKITISDLILQKPGSFTQEEYDIMKSHARAGQQVIQKNMTKVVDQKFVEVAANIAAYHHEKWNGTGYPEGLKGQEIPLCARIVALADVLDALVAKRPYKEGMSITEALAIMKKDRGIYFEPLLFDAFEEMLTEQL